MTRAVLALLAVVAFAGCGGGGGEETSAPPAATPTEGSLLAGTTLDGEPVSLEDFRGKPVFVNVWSSW